MGDGEAFLRAAIFFANPIILRIWSLICIFTFLDKLYDSIQEAERNFIHSNSPGADIETWVVLLVLSAIKQLAHQGDGQFALRGEGGDVEAL